MNSMSTSKPSFSMSRIGGCTLELSAQLLGHEPKWNPGVLERMNLAAREGTKQEEWIAEELSNQGYILESGSCQPCGREGIHVELDLGSYTSKGHVDRFIIESIVVGQRLQVVEIKTMSRFQFDKWKRRGFKAFLKYEYQISCYMHATGLPALYVVKCRDTGQMDLTVLEIPPLELSEIRNHIAGADQYARGRKLGECDGRDLSCQYCYLKMPKEVVPTPELSNPEMVLAVQNWRKGKILSVEAEELIESSKSMLLGLAKVSGQLMVDGVEIKYVPPGFTNRTDTKELKLHVSEEVWEAAQKPSNRGEYITMKDSKEE